MRGSTLDFPSQFSVTPDLRTHLLPSAASTLNSSAVISLLCLDKSQSMLGLSESLEKDFNDEHSAISRNISFLVPWLSFNFG